jgi:cathepsin X
VRGLIFLERACANLNRPCSVVKSPKPLGPTPDSFDWCNISGVNYCTKDLNQHIPQYCGSCWAHGSMSALADRWKFHSKSEKTDFLPAIQVILNCGTNVAGSCGGGSGSGAYQFVYENGIPELTCQQYQAEDNSCSELDICRNCPPGGGPCVSVTNFSKMYIDEFDGVEGEDDIKAEILARGPVACGIDALPLESWNGQGIIDGKTQGDVNHIISLAGWGVTADGTKYWIGRNSWGTYWGAKGWFYITTDYQPGCSWAVPRLEEKQPSITCSSDADSTVTCPADTQCCCDKRSIIKKRCAEPMPSPSPRIHCRRPPLASTALSLSFRSQSSPFTDSFAAAKATFAAPRAPRALRTAAAAPLSSLTTKKWGASPNARGLGCTARY